MALPEVPTREWSELPELPLATIARLLLPAHRDLFAFASVCRSWRSLLRSLSPSLLPFLPPLLFVPFNSPPTPPSLLTSISSNPILLSRFLSPDINSRPFPPSPLPLSSFSSARFLSFSHGHLLFLPTSHPFQPFLDDIITGTRILLHPLPADRRRLPYYYATLTAPSSSPSSTFLLFFSKFAFLSCQLSAPGATWTRHCFSPDISFIAHVVNFKNRLFGINDCARLLELDLSSEQRHANNAVRFVDALRPPRAPREFDRSNFRPQLVCTTDQIFLVLFLFNRGTNSSIPWSGREHIDEVEVYSLDWKRMEWVQVKRLQDTAIFIDCAGKMPVLCEKPERWGGESNCVYVAGPGYDRWMRCSLDDKRVAHRRPLIFLNMHRTSQPSPIWIHPSLFY